jgi:hypothetical protein
VETSTVVGIEKSLVTCYQSSLCQIVQYLLSWSWRNIELEVEVAELFLTFRNRGAAPSLL